MEVYVHVCMEDGVCVSVNVVKGIKWWWCVAKTHGTTNTCSPCITPSPPVTKAHGTTNTCVTPSILAAILHNSFYTYTWSAVSFTHSMKVATSAANTGSMETVKWEMEN